MTSETAQDTTPDNPPPENAVPDLWEAARYYFRWLVSLCGDPCALAGRGRLSRKVRRDILHWLRPVEAIVRRLLVAEAARIAQAAAQKAQDAPATGHAQKTRKPPPQRAPYCRVDFPDPENAARWSVRFSFFGPKTGTSTPRASRFGPRILIPGPDPLANVLSAVARAEGFARHQARMRETLGLTSLPERPRPLRGAGNPWRLAKRIEALARVLENPERYARRLARLLHKHAARLARTCRPPPPREKGRRWRYGDEAVRLASEHALAALTPFDTS
jgi:hypothetical protein